MRVVIAPDKFKGTASAPEVAGAIAAAVGQAGHTAVELPMADGGEGTLDVLGGPNRVTTVTGPNGDPVEAAWRLSRGVAVIEMAQASGLILAGGAEQNDPLAASTRGTGELIAAAIARGATRVIVGLGGSATTDGGLGAVQALGSPTRLGGVSVEVASDVTTTFIDAARVFGPQKGATDAQIAFLEARLRGLAERYRDQFGVDVEHLPRSGAAGGLGGGLAALGATLVSGFELLADEIGLFEAIEQADLVITGEGRLDAQSFEGKVVGGVAEMAFETHSHLVVIAGEVDEGAVDHLPEAGWSVVSLTDRFGRDRAWNETLRCVAEATTEAFETMP